MNEMGEESVDVIFSDPPYGLSNGGMSVHAGKRVSVNKGEWDKSRGVYADFEFHKDWILACRRVLKPNGTLWLSGTYHSIYACGFALQSGGWHILNEICWYKPNAAPHLAARMFAASHETLIWARKTKTAKHKFHYQEMKRESGNWDFLKKANRQMRSVWGDPERDDDFPVTLWAFNTPARQEKVYGKHPTQKPLKLLERIVRASTDVGDTILDPFCGSATTGVAALLHNRKFIGIDSDKNFLERLAIPRLEDALHSTGNLSIQSSDNEMTYGISQLRVEQGKLV
ncbi:MAG: site-specific DNA-methyltransferase [Dehalococcoidia bacterium]|nr:site-specific DNA-methyltransferase [Dehalococcoidia bacterium]